MFFLKTSLAYFFVIESMRFAETARFIALPSQTKVAVCQEMTMNNWFSDKGKVGSARNCEYSSLVNEACRFSRTLDQSG